MNSAPDTGVEQSADALAVHEVGADNEYFAPRACYR